MKILSILWASCCLSFASELNFSEILEGLDSNSFKERELYQEELQTWIKKVGQKKALSEILKIYREIESPELKFRVKKELVEIYAKIHEQGFLGVSTMKFHEGFLITNIDSNSPAEIAGLRSGDLIINFKGVDLFGLTHYEFSTLIKETKPYVNVNIVVSKFDGDDVIKVKLKRKDNFTKKQVEEGFQTWLQKQY